MSENFPSNSQEYKSTIHRVEDVDKAHAMAIESHAKRSEAARARSVGKLIMQEVLVGTDKFGRNAGERFANRTQEAEETLFPQNYIRVSEDMERPALEQAGLYSPMARQEQLQRFYDGRQAITNNGGDAEKATEQIAEWSKQLDTDADKIEDKAAAEYDSDKQS